VEPQELSETGFCLRLKVEPQELSETGFCLHLKVEPQELSETGFCLHLKVKPQELSETGFSLRFKVERTQLGSIDRASLQTEEEQFLLVPDVSVISSKYVGRKPCAVRPLPLKRRYRIWSPAPTPPGWKLGGR
jgi:hypothetical protein